MRWGRARSNLNKMAKQFCAITDGKCFPKGECHAPLLTLIMEVRKKTREEDIHLLQLLCQSTAVDILKQKQIEEYGRKK